MGTLASATNTKEIVQSNYYGEDITKKDTVARKAKARGAKRRRARGITSHQRDARKASQVRATAMVAPHVPVILRIQASGVRRQKPGSAKHSIRHRSKQPLSSYWYHDSSKDESLTTREVRHYQEHHLLLSSSSLLIAPRPSTSLSLSFV